MSEEEIDDVMNECFVVSELHRKASTLELIEYHSIVRVTHGFLLLLLGCLMQICGLCSNSNNLMMAGVALTMVMFANFFNVSYQLWLNCGSISSNAVEARRLVQSRVPTLKNMISNLMKKTH